MHFCTWQMLRTVGLRTAVLIRENFPERSVLSIIETLKSALEAVWGLNWMSLCPALEAVVWHGMQGQMAPSSVVTCAES